MLRLRMWFKRPTESPKILRKIFLERAVRAGLCASRVGAHRGLPEGADRARVPAPMLNVSGLLPRSQPKANVNNALLVTHL